MATTTSNFGWPIPQSTDLVKDGATAIASLGSGVDTSMAELKGGTTGQILSKTSNTDMDFTWINNDQGDITGVTAGTGISGGGTSGDVTITNSMATAIDAKGDLIVGTGSDTFAKLSVGSNGYIPMAASGETTGLKYSPAQTLHGVSLYDSGSVQSLANNTATALTFNSENYDTDGYHSTSSNTSRITIPSGLGGYYLITVSNLTWDLNGTGRRGFSINKNGALAAYGIDIAGHASIYVGNTGSFVLNLAVGDYIEIYATQTSGGNLNVYKRDADRVFTAQLIGV